MNTNFMKLPELFPKLYNFTLPPTVYEYPSYFTSLLAFCVFGLLNSIHYGGVVVVFALHWTIDYISSALDTKLHENQGNQLYSSLSACHCSFSVEGME